MEEAEEYKFFRSLDISVIELITNQLLIAKELLVDNNQLLIEWAEFFDLFCKLRDSAAQQSVNTIRSKWHPATLGYTMEKKAPERTEDEQSEENDEEPSESALSDDYTEDSASESSEGSVVRKPEKKPVPAKTTDSDTSPPRENHNFNPIFMGYSSMKAKDLESQRKQRQKIVHEREMRAIGKARMLSEERLATLIKQVGTQHQQREDKIAKLESAYEDATYTRRREFDNNAMGMTEDVLKSIKVRLQRILLPCFKLSLL
jgi:hypothetical protein